METDQQSRCLVRACCLFHRYLFHRYLPPVLSPGEEEKEAFWDVFPNGTNSICEGSNSLVQSPEVLTC